MTNKQVFVAGTWGAEKAAPYRDEALLLGRLIGASGYGLACGPGNGIARHVVDGYRSISSPRGTVRYYLPRKECMDQVGETVGPGADEVIQTEFDYPMRNVYQVGKCHGLFVITGGDGALEEILPALIDYRIPVALLKESGSAVRAMAALLKIYPEWSELVSIGDSVDELFPIWMAAVESNSGEPN